MNESPAFPVGARSTRLWGMRSLSYAVVAVFFLTSSVPAQDNSEGARERSRRATDDKLEIGFILDVIRQGIQSGRIERIPDFLDGAYTDQDSVTPQKGSRLDVIERLARAVKRAQANCLQPPALENLVGLVEFGWRDVEIEMSEGAAARTAAVVRALGSTPKMGKRVQVVFRLRKGPGGWTVEGSEGFLVLITALEESC